MGKRDWESLESGCHHWDKHFQIFEDMSCLLVEIVLHLVPVDCTVSISPTKIWRTLFCLSCWDLLSMIIFQYLHNNISLSITRNNSEFKWLFSFFVIASNVGNCWLENEVNLSLNVSAINWYMIKALDPTSFTMSTFVWNYIFLVSIRSCYIFTLGEL